MSSIKAGRRSIMSWTVAGLLIASARAQAQPLLSFAPAVPYSIIPTHDVWGVAVDDFNGDGWSDLAVSNWSSNTVSIRPGNGDGTFQPPVVNYAVGYNPTSVAVGDFNADGRIDLAVANFWNTSFTSSIISILLGNGDGTFQAAVNYGTGLGSRSVVVRDFNGDGDLDLAVANRFSSNVSILLGNGDGTFQAAVNYSSGTNSNFVAAGDFNADGRLDLAVTSYNSNDVSILLGNGDGTFQAAVSYGVGPSPESVAVGDFNADGRPDLAVANWGSGASILLGGGDSGVSILVGNGDGTFQAAVSYGVGASPTHVLVGDFNADGRPDLAVANQISNNLSILVGNADGTFQPAINYAAAPTPTSAAVGDFNLDGLLDIAVANQSNSIVTIHLNTSSVCENQPPVADAGADQTVDESTLVTLDGSNSSDPDSDPLTYTWTQLGGPDVGTLDTIDPVHSTFVAPTVPSGGATLTFELVVNDGSADSEVDTVDITIKNVNHPPVADAGSDQAVAEESPVLLDGSASYDVDNDPYTFSWAQIAGPMVDLYNADTENPTFIAPFVWFGGEVLTFEVTVDDGYDSSTDIVEVIVENINHDPLADAGTDQTRNEGALVALNGTASSDPDGDWLMYSWTQTGGPIVTLSGAAGPTPTFTAPLVVSPGTLVYFQLTVDDGYGGVDDDEVIISIQDLNSPPACGLARPDRPMLWPPNHKLVKINILGVTDPENDHITITVTGVTQDEPLNGLGDGDTAPDAVIQGSAVLLRAERAGGGNGRVYRVHFSSDDGAGGTCTGSVTVCVPHDQGQGRECVDDGQIYNSLGT